MLKTMMKVERKANELMEKAIKKVNNKDGLITMDIIKIIFVICIVILAIPLLRAIFN